ncbi:gamma-glutamylcyclotransferase family protein [Sphingobium sp. Sx8-8]|uniref:gamma-glutamylcyclotransferase family protein n=1 Tax=Sphingobium sp. Sx8-8 TaxID=2933617 RepID=UPI001F574951
MSHALLFVYGTLRPGFDGPMADWLKGVASPAGGAVARGRLYRAGAYPVFVPGGSGKVRGDLFALPDADAILTVLDKHEECAAHFSEPHEYRRELLTVQGDAGPVEAWTYIYNWEVGTLPPIEGGDFLA